MHSWLLIAHGNNAFHMTDSVFAKRVLTYWENWRNSDYNHLNAFIVPMENYTYLES